MADGVERLRCFIGELTTLVDVGSDEAAIIERGGAALRSLVAVDDWLPPEFAEPNPDTYRQYLLYCDPWERFSVVSFVWGPGQRTPVHDHTVWGLIGMLPRCGDIARLHLRSGARVVAGQNLSARPGRRCSRLAADRRYSYGRKRVRGPPVDQHSCLRRQYRRGGAARIRRRDGRDEGICLGLRQSDDAQSVGPLRRNAGAPRDLRLPVGRSPADQRSSQTSSQRQPLAALLTVTVTPLTSGRQQVAPCQW
jgi:hypothetical protein